MDYPAFIAATNQNNAFMLHNGIRLTHMERDRAVLEAELTCLSYNLYGAVHGGLFLTIADCAAGGAARSNGMRYVTLNNSFHFYRNTQASRLTAEGRVKNRGATICVVEVEVKDDQQHLLCGGTFTMFCVGKLDEAPEE